MLENSLIIAARDGYPLGARVFGEPKPGNQVIIMSPATGVSQGFYSAFCRWLGSEHRTVLSFDYRGIGSSRGDDIRMNPAKLSDWGEQDLAGIIDYCLETWQPRGLFLVGHSVAGQILGLTPNADRLDGLFLVASVSAHWRYWRGPSRLKIWSAWHLLFPMLVRLFGYLPGRSYGGEDLPAGVALQWARWGRHRDYIHAHGPEVALGFARIKAPLALYSFSDDALATRSAAETLFTWYTGCSEKQHRHLTPASLNLREIGHFSFFRRRSSELFWPRVLEWFEGIRPAK